VSLFSGGSISAINRRNLTPFASLSIESLCTGLCQLSWTVLGGEKGNLSFVVIVVVVLHSCYCRLLSPVTCHGRAKQKLKVVQQATGGCQVKRWDLSHAHPQNIINLSPNHLKSPASGPSPLTTLSPSRSVFSTQPSIASAQTLRDGQRGKSLPASRQNKPRKWLSALNPSHHFMIMPR
jgi:hypothetical protein